MSEMVTGGIGWSPDFGELKPLWVPEAIKRMIMHTLWVPVNDRLPENDKPVLVTLKWGEDNYEITTGEYWKDGKGEHEGWGSFNDYVIAWMPLPDAYREVDA